MFRQCEKAEALEILREDSILSRTRVFPKELLHQPWICEKDGAKLLFFFWEVEPFVYEMHIACPKKSILKSRELAYWALIYVLSFYAKKVITNCPKGKIANMAKKLGMKQARSIQNTIFYEVSLWELERQY